MHFARLGGIHVKASPTLLALSLLILAGCAGPKMTWQQKMDSSAGVERAQAVMTVDEQKNRAAIPLLIKRLEDDNVAVRLDAIDALGDMTGKDFGYVAWDAELRRREAVRRWQDWWNTQSPGAPARADSSTGGTH